MSKILAIGAALFLMTACGGDIDDTDVTGTNDVEVKTINLNEEGGVFAIANDSLRDGAGVEVVRTSGHKVPVQSWLVNLSDHFEVSFAELIEEAPVIVIADPNEELEEADALLRASDERLSTGRGSCPEVCWHCPEDAAYMCAMLCAN